MAEDVELLRRYAQDRSEEAFTALVRRHLPLVYHAALRRTNGDRHLAEDVAQAVFANLAKEAVALERHEVLAGWLYVATRHAAANAMRTERRRRVREQEAVAMSDPLNPELAGAAWEQLRPELDSVMDDLSEPDRNAVLLRYFENRPYAEIGVRFQISEDAARMRVDRALEKLRTLQARRGITSTAAALGGLLAAQSAVAAPAGLAAAVSGSVLAGAGTAAVTAGSAGLIVFMTTNKIILSIAVGAILLGGGVAFYEASEAQRIQIELGEAREAQVALKARLASRDAELQTLQKTMSAAKSAGATTDEASAPPKSPTVSPSSTKIAAVNPRQALYANSEYVALEIRISEMSAKLNYGPLYARLHWSPERIREFERLLVEKQRNSFDVIAAASANDLDPNNPALKKEWDDRVFTENRDKIMSLLGNEDFAAYINYQPWASLGTLEQLAGNLYYSDTPLTASQGDAMAPIIERHSVVGSGGKLTTDWPAIYAEAGKGILSAAQLEILKTVNDRNDLFHQKNALEQKIREGGTAPKN